MTTGVRNLRIKEAKSNRRAFSNWFRYLGMGFEKRLFRNAEITSDYDGGLWEASYFGEAGYWSYFPVPPIETEVRKNLNPELENVVRVYNAGNYYQGYMTPRCHSFVTNGEIRFIGDCTHELAGKTVNLKPLIQKEINKNMP